MEGPDAERSPKSGLGEEIAKQLHATFLDAMETRYKEILSFVGFVLPALGAFLFLFLRYETEGRTSSDALLLFLGTLAALFLLTWGAMYALATSYRYRYLQASCYKIEEHSGASRWIPRSFKPKSSTLQKRLSLSIAPGILQMHLFVMLFAIASLASVFYFIIDPSSSLADPRTQKGASLASEGPVLQPALPSLSTSPGIASFPFPKPEAAIQEPPQVGTRISAKSAAVALAPTLSYRMPVLLSALFCIGLIYYLGAVHFPSKMDKIVKDLDGDSAGPEGAVEAIRTTQQKEGGAG